LIWGAETGFCSRRSPRVSEADVSPAMVSFAKANTSGEKNIRINVQRGSVLPFADACFDCVLAAFSLRYFFLPEILPELARVLKAGGKLIVVDQFARGAEKPGLLPRVLSRMRFVKLCLCHPLFYLRLIRLVAMPGWKATAARFPGTTSGQFLETAARYFDSVLVKRLNFATNRIIIGISAMKKADCSATNGLFPAASRRAPAPVRSD
jgi:SAM-dependent methyltransferase